MIKWDKTELTYCVNSTIPLATTKVLEQLMLGITKQVEELTPLRFTKVTSDDCDISIKFEEIDGPGGILGFVFLPSQSDMIESCNCGDITLDTEDVFSRPTLQFVLLHEFLHSMGIEHTSNEVSIMNPSINSLLFGQTIAEDPYSLRELILRYPSETMPGQPEPPVRKSCMTTLINFIKRK